MIALDIIGATQMSGIIESAVAVMQLVMTVNVLCCNVLYILINPVCVFLDQYGSHP